MIKKIILPLICVLLMFTQNKVAFAEVNAIAANVTDWNGLFDNPEVFKGTKDKAINNTTGDSLEIKDSKEYVLEVPVVVDSVGYYATCYRIVSYNDGICSFSISLLDEDGKQLSAIYESLRSTSTAPYPVKQELKLVNTANVKRVKITASTTNAEARINEFELFGKYVKYEGVSDVKVKNITSHSADLSYKNPVINDFVSNEIKLNNLVVYKDGKTENFTLKDLQPLTEYKVEISALYKNGAKEIVVTNFKTTEKEPEKPRDVTNVKWSVEDSRLTMTYTKDPNADYVNIYRDGKLVSEKNTSSEFIDKDLQSDSKYVYLITSHNNVGQSPGVTIEVKTPSKEVSNLAATATEKEVSLTWKMPSYNSLDFARVYRKKVEKGMFAMMFKSGDTYEALFETNGTTFKDLTVKADTQYEYKVTTVDTKGNETDGKTISIKTKQNNVSGGNTDKNENGDYVITWKSPTTGKIKVLVGGKEYAIVPASDQKIVIPKDKMVFDLIGMPDVKLVPIDENGVEGPPTKPGGNGGGIGEIVGGGEIGKVINPENVLKGGVALLGVVGAFVLLGLAFRVVPKLVKMIRDAFSNKKDERLYSGRRRVEE